MILGIIISTFALFLLIYYKLTKNRNYWDDRGVTNTGFKFFWGDDGTFIGQKESFHEFALGLYQRFPNERYIGCWSLFGIPYLMIRNDFELIRSIWIRDFDHFSIANGNTKSHKTIWPSDRNEKLMLNNIQSATGDEWKNIRTSFSPIFTSGKLKKMTPLLQSINKKMNNCVLELVKSQEAFETKEFAGKFSLDGLASCAFGVEAGSFDKTETEFLKHSKNVFKFKMSTFPKMILSGFTPNIIKKAAAALGIYNVFNYPFANEHSKFLMHVIEASFKQRKESKTKRNDLLDMMIQAVEGTLEKDEDNMHASDQFEKDAKIVGHIQQKNLSYDDVIATAILLLAAGYETTGGTMGWILYDLAMNPNCQETLYEEVKDAGNDVNKLSYETLQTMPYLDAVIHETLRRHPPLAVLERVCTKDYKVPHSSVVIRKGDLVRSNNIGVSLDPEIYPNPLEYNPENFLREYASDRNPYSFMTFSLGPRNCIGMRFSMYEMKVCISNLVSNFRLVPCEKTPKYEDLEWSPQDVFGGNKGGLWIKCEAR